MRLLGVLLGVVVTCLSAAGCERLGAGLDIVNETGQTLYFYESPIRPDGRPWRYETSDCSTSDLELYDEDGAVFVELTQEWCPDQTWTVTGGGEGTLEDR